MSLPKQLRLISNAKQSTHVSLCFWMVNYEFELSKRILCMNLLQASIQLGKLPTLVNERKHNTLKLQINSRFAHNFSFYLPFPSLLFYFKSLIVASTKNLAGFEWMINRLRKQEQIGKATFQFTTTCNHRKNTSSKAKNTHFLQLQIFGLSARLVSSLFTVPSHPASSTWPGQLRNKAEHQSSKHPPFAEPAHALFRGRVRMQALTTRNYTLELPTFGVIARVNPIQVQWKGLALRGLPPWSQYLPCQVSMKIPGTATGLTLISLPNLLTSICLW